MAKCSTRLEIEGLRVVASLEALHCCLIYFVSPGLKSFSDLRV